MSGKETFDFKTVKVSEQVSYLQPGQYVLGIEDAKYVKPEGKKADGSAKTPYLEVKFSGKAGQVTANMYITVKAFERLQYLYTQWFEKECDKEFDSIDAIGAFFEKVFTHERAKKVTKRVIIGGRTSEQGKVFAELPFKNFVISDADDTFEEGPFEVNSHKWIYHVKPAAITPATGRDELILGNMPTNKLDSFDDLPF